MTWRRWLAPAVALALAAAGTWVAVDAMKGSRGADAPVRGLRVVPATTRIKVEVLNATDTRGLARRAMFALRDAGFDVVYFGNSVERVDSSVVRDRSGHPAWAALAARAVRGARVESAPDSSHFLDLTILVGRNWTPPREPFYP